MKKLLSISELAKLLNLINKKTKKPLNHVIRYWEKEFPSIKPVLLNKRRYYSSKQIEKIELIKYLLKDKGLTINGVQKVIKSNINSLDDYNSISLQTDYIKQNIKIKSKRILEKIKTIKHGKKVSH
tara:strand:+ start:10383 stop:10760 length:378 start_codon:yes stop_codon:yes gene_type:complete